MIDMVFKPQCLNIWTLWDCQVWTLWEGQGSSCCSRSFWRFLTPSSRRMRAFCARTLFGGSWEMLLFFVFLFACCFFVFVLCCMLVLVVFLVSFRDVLRWATSPSQGFASYLNTVLETRTTKSRAQGLRSLCKPLSSSRKSGVEWFVTWQTWQTEGHVGKSCTHRHTCSTVMYMSVDILVYMTDNHQLQRHMNLPNTVIQLPATPTKAETASSEGSWAACAAFSRC